MTSDITKSILDLKDKLTNLEKSHDQKIKDYEKREKTYESLKAKFNEIQTLQGDVIYFNIGGKKCPAGRKLVINSIYKSVLKDVLNNLEKIGKTKADTYKIFIDRNPDTFIYILEILRKSTEAYEKSNCDVSLISDLSIYIDPKLTNDNNLTNDIKFYFKEDAEMVLDHFKLYTKQGEAFGSTSKSNVVGGVESVKVSTDFPSNQLDPYRAKAYKDISKKNSKKGYFVSYDSNIIFGLENEIDLKTIEIKPFSANLDYWVPCEGANAFIFSSMTGEGETWDFCCSIPDDYGIEFENDHTYTLTFDKRKAKYIKIQTGDYTLSVSYIKFN